jgi:hypothetical protein
MEIEKRLLREFMDNSRVIPDFIDTKSLSNKNAFFEAQNLFSTLSILFKPVVLNQNRIDEVFLDFTEILETLIEIDPYVSLDYLKMMKNILNYYEGIALEEEAFEVAENIKNLKLIIKNIIL